MTKIIWLAAVLMTVVLTMLLAAAVAITRAERYMVQDEILMDKDQFFGIAHILSCGK